MATNPALPPVPLSGDQNQRRFNEAVRNTFASFFNGPNRFATITDVGNIVGDTGGDPTVPPAPSGLTADGAFENIILAWGYPDSSLVAYTRIYRANVNDFTAAAVIGNTEGKVWADPVGPGSSFYYWVTNVSPSGVESAPNGVSGTLGTTAPNVDYLLDQLAGEILASSLAADLQARINLIDGPVSMAGSVAHQVQTETDARVAALSAEALARQDADESNASDFSALAAQVRGTYEGTDLTSVTTGLIAQERNARVTQGDALAQQISLLTAGVAGGFDPYNTWYFDNTTDGWTGASATVAYSSGTITVDGTGTNPGVQLAANLSTAVTGGQYPVVRARIKRTAGSGWSGKLRWRTSGHDFGSANELTTATPAPAVGEWTVIEWNLQEIADWTGSSIQNLQLLLGATAADDFAIDWISVGRNGPGASVASLLAEQSARATADTAEITARQALSTKLVGVADPSTLTLSTVATGLLADERNARSTADSNEVTARQLISSKMFGTTDPSGIANLGMLTAGLLYDEKVARTTADTAEATARTTLSATVQTKGSTYWQDSPPATGTVYDLWIDTNDGNKAYKWNGSAWAEASDTRIASNAAAITTESTARANGDSALSSQITTVQSSLNGQIASVQTTANANASAITGLQAQYTIKVDVNGRVAGIGLASSGTSSQIQMLADKFAIVIPGVAGSAPQVPFVTTTINGVAGVGITNAFIGDAAITNAKIANAAVDNAKIANLDAAKINTGYLSAARIQTNSLDANKIITSTLAAQLALITTAYIENANIENLTIGGEKFQTNAVSNCAYMSIGSAGSGSGFALNTWVDWDTTVSGGGTVDGGGTGGSGGGGIGGGGLYQSGV